MPGFKQPKVGLRRFPEKGDVIKELGFREAARAVMAKTLQRMCVCVCVCVCVRERVCMCVFMHMC